MMTLLLLDVPSAQAAAPTITSFNPTSGPVGTSVQINGTGFQDGSDVSAVTFNGVAATFTINSDVLITATVPSGASDGNIEVTDSEGTAMSPSNFDVTTPLPTITSFTPNTGSVGTSVTITGTNLTGATSVYFNGVGVSPGATFTVDSDTQITAIVPPGATTGPILVFTPSGAVMTSTNFMVEGPIEPIEKHRSNITLRLSGHLVATGDVNVPDGTNACQRRRLVKVQRRISGSWRTVGQDRTSPNGSYRESLPDKGGTYRSVVKKSKLANNDVCKGDVSRRRKHNHPDPVRLTPTALIT